MTTDSGADAPPVLGKDYEQLLEYLRDPDTLGPVPSPKRFQPGAAH